MLTKDRQRQLLAYVSVSHFQIEALAKLLFVSVRTVITDVDHLELKGKLVVSGGWVKAV